MESATYGAPGARTVDAGRAVGWWGQGWSLFMKNAGMNLVLSLIFLIICIVLSIIPFLGGIALALLGPVFVGSWLMIAAKLESGGTLEVGDLFAAFKEKLTPLIVIGGIVLGATIVFALAIMVLGVGAAVGIGASQSGGVGFFAIILTAIIGLAFALVVGLAMWFAPALVVFRGMPPVEAIKTSFAAGLKNIVPAIVFGIIYFVASIVASIPIGLGWFVLVPVLMFTMYASYKEVLA